jgi:hypothetical protein
MVEVLAGEKYKGTKRGKQAAGAEAWTAPISTEETSRKKYQE